MLDICMCADMDCPKYNECLRGGLIKKVGIYTASCLSEICNESNEYELLITDDRGDKEC